MAAMHKISKLPTFVFYKGGQLVPELEFSGADIAQLENIVKQHGGAGGGASGGTSSFGGSGNKLGGGAGTGGAVESGAAGGAANTLVGGSMGGGHVMSRAGNPRQAPRPKVKKPPVKQPEHVSSPMIHVAEDQPITEIQFKLLNGSKLIQKFNHSHRIQDLFSFVQSQDQASRDFQVISAYFKTIMKLC